MALIIKAVDPHDPICVELIAELSAELGAMYGDDGSGAFTPDDVVGERAAFIVAWLDGAAVGCGALRPMSDASIAEVKRMYVRAAARGQGISRKLLAHLEQFAQAYGYTAIWLETGLYQEAAMRLYASAGYRERACYSSYADDPLSICYEKLLRYGP